VTEFLVRPVKAERNIFLTNFSLIESGFSRLQKYMQNTGACFTK